MNRVGISVTKKPHGLLPVDGKRPGGLTLISWRESRFLVWDVTEADSTAASYLAATATVTGSAAESTAVRKEMKYIKLLNRYHFFPIAIEYMDCQATVTSFLSDLGRCIIIPTIHSTEKSFLFQRIP